MNVLNPEACGRVSMQSLPRDTVVRREPILCMYEHYMKQNDGSLQYANPA